jgi:hypothetical protein
MSTNKQHWSLVLPTASLFLSIYLLLWFSQGGKKNDSKNWHLEMSRLKKLYWDWVFFFVKHEFWNLLYYAHTTRLLLLLLVNMNILIINCRGNAKLNS